MIPAMYILIFANSFRSAFMLPVGSESGWFAAQAFGGYNMIYATAAAFTASVFSMFLNYGIGYYLSLVRKKTLFSEEAYNRVHKIFERYIIWIFIIPPFPILGVLAALAGLFHLSWRRYALLIIAGRIGYYAYYLFYHPVQPL